MIFPDLETQEAMAPPEPDMADYVPAGKEDLLREMTDNCRRDDPFLYAWRGSLYNQVVFVHGLQNLAYSYQRNGMVDLRDFDSNPDRLYASMNVILPAIESQKAVLLSSKPQMEAAPRTRDEHAIEGARYLTDALSWASEFHKHNILRRQGAAYFAEMGSFIHFVSWDPTGGRKWQLDENNFLFEGAPVWEIHSPLEWHFHPHATSVEESPFAYRICFVSRDWAKAHYPQLTDQDFQSSTVDMSSQSGRFFANAIRNMTPSHGIAWSNLYDEKNGFVEMHFYYRRSSPFYPEGRMGVAIGNDGYPTKVVHDGPNPHIDHETGQRDLPVVLSGHIDVPGRLEKESLVPHMIPHQTYINEMASMILEHLSLNAFPRLEVPDGMSEGQFTDAAGTTVRRPPGDQTGARFIEAPNISSDVPGFFQMAVQNLDNLVRPFGPLQSEHEKRISSGIQKALAEESKSAQYAPMLGAWGEGWYCATKKWANNLMTFATLPFRLGVVGEDGGPRETFFDKSLIGPDIKVTYVEASEMPTSRAATLGEWTELLKTPPIQQMALQDPSIVREMWSNLGKEGLARTYRDHSAHREKVYRNIQAIRMGEIRLIEMQDHADTHIQCLSNWMVTPEYERARQEDPELPQRLQLYIQSIQEAKARELAAQFGMKQLGVQDEKGNPPKDSSGNGGVSRGTQGFSKSMSPAQDQGGNPTGPEPSAETA